jgi:hypothetical protein
LLAGLGFVGVAWWRAGWPFPPALAAVLNPPGVRVVVVSAGESIAAAIEAARPGTTIVVEPGEYSEVLRLKDHVRLKSRLPQRAVLRLPSTAAEGEVAVRAEGIANSELVGFRILGGAASPLGIGVLVRNAEITIYDVEIVGARLAAVDVGAGGASQLLASSIHDNPGAGLIARPGNTTRIAYNIFSRNGSATPGSPSILLEPGAQPSLQQNVMLGMDPRTLEGAARPELAAQNFFLPPRQVDPPVSPGSRGRSGK